MQTGRCDLELICEQPTHSALFGLDDKIIAREIANIVMLNLTSMPDLIIQDRDGQE